VDFLQQIQPIIKQGATENQAKQLFTITMYIRMINKTYEKVDHK